MSDAQVLMFDVYGTLATWEPSREIVQGRALAKFGINVTKEDIDRGYAIADSFMAQKSLDKPLRLMSSREKDDFFAQFEQKVLAGAGIHVDLDLAGRIWNSVATQEYEMAIFDDVLNGLDALRGAGFTVGIVSNMNVTGAELANNLGLTGHIDFAVTSEEAGSSKPEPRIFEEALRRAGDARPEESIMVGDQPFTDMDGAVGAGMRGVLLDRYDAHPDYDAHPRVRSMDELCSLLCVG